MNWDERLQNRTMTIAGAVDIPGDDGVDVLVVASKLAFRFDLAGGLSAVPRPLRRFEVGDEAGTIRYPRDFALRGPGTDCMLVGTARPGLAPATERLLTLQVGSASPGSGLAVKKSVRLFGPRVYMKGPSGVRPGPAANVVATPLRYDLCYGGFDVARPDQRVRENPRGRGFALEPDRLVGTEAHRLEPADPALHASAGCFAPLDDSWSPRVEHAGTFDDAWRRQRAPAAPVDADARFHSCVRPEQRSSAPLTLPLVVDLRGFFGDDPVALAIPAYGIDVVTELRGAARGAPDASEAHDAPLSRVLVDVDECVIELTFVAIVPLPMKWERVQRIRVLARGTLPEHVKPRADSSVVGGR